MHLLATDAAKLRQASICVVKWSSVLKTSMVWRCVVRVGLVSRSFDTEHFRTVAGGEPSCWAEHWQQSKQEKNEKKHSFSASCSITF